MIEEGNYVKLIATGTLAKVAELIETDTTVFAVLVSSDGWALGIEKVDRLTKINVRIEMVEQWTEI